MLIIHEKYYRIIGILFIATLLPQITLQSIIDSRTSLLAKRPTPLEYDILRKEFFEEQQKNYLGSDITLSPMEERVNKILMNLKSAELKYGFDNPGNFSGAVHIFESFERISKSQLFQIISKMPKAGILHAHDTAMLSTEKIIEFTYRGNLWYLGDLDDTFNPPRFLFSLSKPENVNNMEWSSIADARLAIGNDSIDNKLANLFNLYSPDPTIEHKDINFVWNRFKSMFRILEGIVCYDQVWKAYFYQALQEILDDGVQYLEFRGMLPNVYSINGTVYSPVQVVQLYVEVLEKFKREHPTFINAKLIFSPARAVSDEGFQHDLQVLEELRLNYGNFVVGFDLVGQEDAGRPLKDFAHKLLQLPSDINFFFHAGETNWNGMSSDENMIDAVIIGPKRIGHGYAILKYPKVLEVIKQKNICIEINPISNQVLKLVDDFRNHPAVHLFTQNYPVVISGDDNSFWNTKPLSHDYYITFLAMSSSHADLRFIEKLIMNSFTYSSLTENEKQGALSKWRAEWEKWLSWVINNFEPELDYVPLEEKCP
uniref:Adenosine deaminase n=1 Tax=Culicoides sonorensis TaxID=179676 RepID=A0A336K6N7_CULSO